MQYHGWFAEFNDARGGNESRAVMAGLVPAI
jgi:hypothetical protein